MARARAERDADRAQVAGMVTDLRTAVVDLRTAIKALPAPVSRTPAQRRDAVIMRTLVLLVRAMLATWGVAVPSDRDAVEA